jgi:predicted DNA-binding transcriptional regulator AlpA
MLGVQRRYVTDVMTKEPGFPAPVIDLSQRLRRWSEPAVLEYWQRRTQARRGTKLPPAQR